MANANAISRSVFIISGGNCFAIVHISVAPAPEGVYSEIPSLIFVFNFFLMASNG